MAKEGLDEPWCSPGIKILNSRPFDHLDVLFYAIRHILIIDTSPQILLNNHHLEMSGNVKMLVFVTCGLLEGSQSNVIIPPRN